MVNFFWPDQIKSVQNGSNLIKFGFLNVNMKGSHIYQENKHGQLFCIKWDLNGSNLIKFGFLAYQKRIWKKSHSLPTGPSPQVYTSAPSYLAYPVYPFCPVESIQSIQSKQSIQSIQAIQSIIPGPIPSPRVLDRGSQPTGPCPWIPAHGSIHLLQSIQPIQSVQSVQSVQFLQSIQSIQSNQSIQSIQSIQAIQSIIQIYNLCSRAQD